MLSQKVIVDLFKDSFPTVEINVVSRVPYVGLSMQNPFIIRQMDEGIYDRENIYSDFLSVVCSFTSMNRIDICIDLLNDQMAGVDDDLSMAYIKCLVIHEQHHFDHPNQQNELFAETEANAYVTNNYADLNDQAIQFEMASPVFQRVYDRMRNLGLINDF